MTATAVLTHIEIDGTYNGKRRYSVRFDKHQIWLRGKSFTYLVKLAYARRAGGKGWIYKTDIEVGDNQARYLYRLKLEIQSQIGDVDGAIVENNREGYYRLAFEPRNIRINEDNLRDFPDVSIRQLAVRREVCR